MTASNGYGTASELLAMTERTYREVPSGGKTWRIQSLTEGERAQFETPFNMAAEDPKTYQRARPRLLALCLVDAGGHRILSDAQAVELFKVNCAVTIPLYRACKEHNAFDDGDLEEKVKNSEETNAADSS